MTFYQHATLALLTCIVVGLAWIGWSLATFRTQLSASTIGVQVMGAMPVPVIFPGAPYINGQISDTVPERQ